MDYTNPDITLALDKINSSLQQIVKLLTPKPGAGEPDPNIEGPPNQYVSEFRPVCNGCGASKDAQHYSWCPDIGMRK